MSWRGGLLWRLWRCLIFCVACSLPNFALSENNIANSEFGFSSPYFEAVGDLETLGDSVISALVQDEKGLLWIGTSKGLVQYDGYRFRRFVHNQHDANSLVGEYILCLALGSDGRLWIGTNSNGISAFNPNTERFDNFRHDPDNPASIGAGRIWALAANRDGGVWAATDQGLELISKDGQTIRHYRRDAANPHSVQDERIRSLLVDKAGDLWLGQGSGLQLLKQGSDKFISIVPKNAAGEPLPNAFSGFELRSLMLAQDGKLWIGTRKNGAAWLEPGSHVLHWLKVDATRADSLTHAWIKSMVQVADGAIWMGTVGGGINVVDPRDGRIIQRLRRDPSIASSLAVDDLGALLLDQAGLLWVGTWGGGLQRFHVANQAIRVLRHSPSQAQSLSHAEVRSVLELANGQLLFGVNGNGIDIIDRKLGLVGGYRPAPAGNLPAANIMTLAQTGDGAIWAGSQQNGIFRLAPGSDQWQPFGLKQGLPGLQTRSILLAKNGDLWLGTTEGVARLSRGGVRFETLKDVNGKPMRSGVEIIVQDRQERIWLGSNGGLWQVENGKLLPHLHDTKRASSLGSDDVRGLVMDAQGTLWVGTPQGLEKMTRLQDGKAEFEFVDTHIPQMEPGENLLLDNRGRIWSNNFVYEPAQNRTYLLTKADGFDIGTAWLSSYLRTRDGLFLYGGTHGVAIVDPQKYQPWSYQPPVVVSELKINGKTNTASELLHELTLTPQRRSFSLEFAALDYSSPSKLRYSYRLQGYERDWIETDANHRVASYSNLWPGSYKLQVRATNRLGQISDKQLEIAVRVLPAFWQTSWFVACAILLSAGLVFGAYSWRVARMRAKARQLQQLVEARTADILHLAEIGQDLTATLDTEQAFARVYQQVRTRLDAHVFSIGLMSEDKSALIFVYDIENGVRHPATTLTMDDRNRPAVWCVREQRELSTNCTADLLNYVDTILPPAIGSMMETVIYIPLIVEQKVLGCLSVQSPKQHAYHQNHLEFLRVLASYTAIALANSGAHSKLSHAHEELAAAHLHLKETQARLVHSEKMASLGGLVAGIAHEINTPLGTTLTAISGATQALLELQQGVDCGRISKARLESNIQDCMDYAALAYKTANRAANLITTFKTIAVSHTASEMFAFDLSNFLKQLLFAIYRPTQLAGCEYELDLPNELPVCIVQSALQEAITRILDNVQVHAFSDGRTGLLRIHAAVDADGIVTLEIRDNGHGIAAAHLPHVFDPFFTTKGGDQGHVGLGLHVAYNHVKRGLHGEITIDSTLGEGTCVTLRFACRTEGAV